MEAQRKKCVIYVDYEDLMVGLSYFQYWEIDDLLVNLLEKARHHFQVQRALVLGDWSRHASRRQLESQGFICRSISGTAPEINQEILLSIAKSLDSNEAAEVYVFVSGRSSHGSLLRQLRQAGRESILWIVEPPSPSDQALCSNWELITPTGTFESSPWPRQVMLQAMILVADHLQNDPEVPFLMGHLLDRLRQLNPFNTLADRWLNVAISEQIILVQHQEDLFDSLYGYLNKQHAVVQKALLTRERILTTMSAMLGNRDWIAFSALEAALRTSKVLAESQSYRRAWLELLVAEQVLITTLVSQPDGPFTVTTLSLNRDHPVIATLHKQRVRNLIHLVILISNFMIRKGHIHMAVSHLLRILTKTTSRVEARDALNAAIEQGIVQINRELSQNSTSFVARVLLNQNHQFVQAAIAEYNQVILQANSVLTLRNFRVSESMLAEEFIARGKMKEKEALFWIELLVSEGILSVDQGSVFKMIRIESEDPVVKQAFQVS